MARYQRTSRLQGQNSPLCALGCLIRFQRQNDCCHRLWFFCYSNCAFTPAVYVQSSSYCIIGRTALSQSSPNAGAVVKKLISVNRSATWITPEIGATAAESRDTVFTEEQKKHWAENKHDFLKVRKQVEKAINHLYEIHFMGSDVQNKMSTQFAAQMRERLKAKPEVAERLIPKFGVGCRRYNPLFLGDHYKNYH